MTAGEKDLSYLEWPVLAGRRTSSVRIKERIILFVLQTRKIPVYSQKCEQSPEYDTVNLGGGAGSAPHPRADVLQGWTGQGDRQPREECVCLSHYTGLGGKTEGQEHLLQLQTWLDWGELTKSPRTTPRQNFRKN